MKRTTLYLSLTGALLFSAAAFGISAAVDTPRTLMSRGDYSMARDGIERATRASLARCRDLDGAARDICKAEARAEARVKKGDLDARYYGTVAAGADAELARAKARYDVAKAKCGAAADDARAQCVQAARTDKDRAIAQASLPSS